MTLDRLIYCFVISLLPILFLPFPALIGGGVVAGLVILFGLYRRNVYCLILGGGILYAYLLVMGKSNGADNISPQKTQEVIQIVQILKQQEYQTAIAKRVNGERLYVTWQSSEPLLLNAHYQAELTIRPISARLNIGNFDRQKWYFAQHITATASLKVAKKLSNRYFSPRTSWLYRAKQQTDHLPTQGLLLALAFGERAWLLQQHWQIFQQTTTAHLIAISGLHIALAMTFGFWFAKGVQWICLRFRRATYLAYSYLFPRICGFGFAFGYSFLAGFSIPTLRALLAISLVLLCQWLRKHYTPAQFWWRVVALLLLCDPLSLLSDSFWLSILAVATLIFWYRYFPLKKWFHGRCKNLPKIHRLWLSLLHLQIGIWLVFSPVQFFFFDGTSPYALPANLLIVPMYSFILVPIIFISLLTDNLFNSWQLADWIAQASLVLIEPFSHDWIYLSQGQQWLWLTINLLILLFLFNWIERKPWRFYLGVLLGTLLLNIGYVLWQQIKPAPLIQWIHFDVGQGLAMAFIYREEGRTSAIFYDTGSSWQDNSMMSLEILPYLRREGIDVKAVFVSHDDNDHAGGVKALLEAYPNAKLVLSGQNQYGSNQTEPCIAGSQWYFGDLSLRAVYPTRLSIRAKNEDSCVLLATLDKHKLLLTGDSGIEQERIFAPQVGKIDFLQVGHHGSKTSTGHSLLAATQPDIAIISAGRWNPWKLPNRDVVANLLNYRVKILNTAETGMIRVNFYPENYSIEKARAAWSPWYSRYFGQEK